VIAAGRLAHVRASLEVAEPSLEEPSGAIVDTAAAYRQDAPVVIRVRRRGRRYDISDDGGSVRLAGRPPGWLDRAERVVATEGFNINRRGVISVPAVAGRDIATLAVRLADTSRAVYLELLELQASARP